MEKNELLERVGDLYNYVQTVRNKLDQVDSAIERLQADIAQTTNAGADNSDKLDKLEGK